MLCVDDAADHLVIRVELLKRFGYDALAAQDHRSALRAAADTDIDLCITDYHLQNGETGENIALDLRVIRPRAAMVLLTGDAEIARLVGHSFDAVLIKDETDVPALHDVIVRFIGRAASCKPGRSNTGGAGAVLKKPPQSYRGQRWRRALGR